MKRARAILAGAAVFMALPMIATAHNAGHITRPDGTCQELGSSRSAPLVGQDRTQLDLVPETANPPRDEYGVSFVGYWGRTPIAPGPCPAQAAVSAAPDSYDSLAGAQVSYQ